MRGAVAFCLGLLASVPALAADEPVTLIRKMKGWWDPEKGVK